MRHKLRNEFGANGDLIAGLLELVDEKQTALSRCEVELRDLVDDIRYFRACKDSPMTALFPFVDELVRRGLERIPSQSLKQQAGLKMAKQMVPGVVKSHLGNVGGSDRVTRDPEQSYKMIWSACIDFLTDLGNLTTRVSTAEGSAKEGLTMTDMKGWLFSPEISNLIKTVDRFLEKEKAPKPSQLNGIITNALSGALSKMPSESDAGTSSQDI